jgi:hypothetical protein
VVESTLASSANETENGFAEFLSREYLPVIRQFPENELQRSLLRDSVITLVRTKDLTKKPPCAPVSDSLPHELAFLGGPLVDLGFDKLNLPQADIEAIVLAFCAEGVQVPGTPHRLRHSVMSLFTLAEPAIGHEVMLPTDWRVTVRSHSWIGKKVVPTDFDPSRYEDVWDGYSSRREDHDGYAVLPVHEIDGKGLRMPNFDKSRQISRFCTATLIWALKTSNFPCSSKTVSESHSRALASLSQVPATNCEDFPTPALR